MELTINGARYTVADNPGLPLVYVLRDELGLTGTKFGCGAGLCGACTILLDDKPVRSCQTPASLALNAQITTIEGLASEGRLHQVQAAWITEQVPQCGYCQPGMIMSTVGLLLANPQPDDAAINTALAGNLCRCGTYVRIRRAIRRASGRA